MSHTLIFKNARSCESEHLIFIGAGVGAGRIPSWGRAGGLHGAGYMPEPFASNLRQRCMMTRIIDEITARIAELEASALPRSEGELTALRELLARFQRRWLH